MGIRRNANGEVNVRLYERKVGREGWVLCQRGIASKGDVMEIDEIYLSASHYLGRHTWCFGVNSERSSVQLVFPNGFREKISVSMKSLSIYRILAVAKSHLLILLP